MSKNELNLPDAENAPPGREMKMPVTNKHFVNGNAICEPLDEKLSKALFGLGCFWGAEKIFWQLEGVFSTAVGYAAGTTKNPGYQEVCSGMTGHNEVVLVIYDEEEIKYTELLKNFWQSHDPTQGMRQGNDIGTQYRSGIYTFNNQQQEEAEESREIYQQAMSKKEKELITTEIIVAPEFYYAEDYHQQYLAKNPGGYCGLGGTGILYPV